MNSPYVYSRVLRFSTRTEGPKGWEPADFEVEITIDLERLATYAGGRAAWNTTGRAVALKGAIRAKAKRQP